MNRLLMEWANDLKGFRLPRWDELVQFEIYSDQLIQLVNNYLNLLIINEEDLLTSAKINNYVKLKLMPKPHKKKYTRVHIAYLIAITALKQVMTIEQVNAGINYQAEISGLRAAYNDFCEEIERAISNSILCIYEKYDDLNYEITKERKALSFAANALANKIIADKILEINKQLRKEDQDEQK